jgi:hypothetical protein
VFFSKAHTSFLRQSRLLPPDPPSSFVSHAMLTEVAVLLLSLLSGPRLPMIESAPAPPPRLRASDLRGGLGMRVASGPLLNVMDSGSDGGFIAYFRISRAMFAEILILFMTSWNATQVLTKEPRRQGGICRPARRALSGDRACALTLRFLAVSTLADDLMVTWDIGRSTVSRYLKLGLGCLHIAVRHHPQCKISIPTDVNYLHELTVLGLNYCGAQNTIAATDGWTTPTSNIRLCEIPVANYRPDGAEVRIDPMYNGKIKDTCFKHLFLWGLDGLCWMAILGRPGGQHDAVLYEPMKTMLVSHWRDVWGRPSRTDTFHVLGDSAFPADDAGVLVRALTDAERARFGHRAVIDEAMRVHNILRNCSEWGNAGLLNCFGVFGNRRAVHRDDAHRQDTVFDTCVRLFNFRVRVLRTGQIHTVFDDMRDDD